MQISENEHKRWFAEKVDMGWRLGIAHVGALSGKDDKVMRECTRLHHDLVPFVELDDLEQFKDSAPMLKMLELIHEFEGLSIYRM